MSNKALHVNKINLIGVIAAGYTAKVQLEDRQAYRDSMRYGRHFVLIWKTSKLMEPSVHTNSEFQSLMVDN